MRDFSNIEKSKRGNGEYVGYAGETVWRIVRLDRRWQAIQQHGGGGRFSRNTLADISAALEATAAFMLTHVEG